MKQEDKIGVFVRIRPYQQKQQTSSFIISQSDTNIVVKQKEREREQELRFGFDHIFQPQTQQKDIFDKVGQPIVNASFEGINGTIFAYGQTSSGKTFTCVGPDCQDQSLKGLLPRCVDSIFERISNSPNYLQFRIKVSMVEIYMQKLRDLLDSAKTDLKIRQNKTKGIYIQDITEQYVSNAEETIKVFKKGVSNRAVAYTNMNDASSRSHMAFILTLHQNNLKDGSAKSGKITVVDLAGSEKVSKTGAEGRVLGQAKQINKSLSSLGNVINALTEAKSSHIPYRDSKLTRLLQESLGGNSKTSLIINISPSAYNASQSVSSLRFGFRAKQIKNKPKINKEYTIAQLLILLQKSEKRNSELQLLLKQLTANKNVKKKGEFIENLLESDNPIMSGIDDEPEPVLNSKKSVMKKIKKFYESQIGSEDEEEKEKKKYSAQLRLEVLKQEKNREKSEIEAKYNEIFQQKEEQIAILGEQLTRINNERVNLIRELDICQERLECATKEARISVMKVNSEKRQNENLLQKYIQQSLEKQQKDQVIKNLHLKIVNFEEKMLKLNKIQNDAKKRNSVFGTSQDYNRQTVQILEQTLNQNEEFKKEAIESIEKEAIINDLTAKVKKLETQLSTFEHLQESKEGFIKEKLKFITERDQIFRDLQNRVQKVILLQQELDSEREKRKHLEQMLNLEASSKTKKIVSLQNQLRWVNEEYYVLKGQQSSWKKTNEKLQKKNKESVSRIFALEADNLELNIQIESLAMRCEDLQKMNENTSVLDFEVSQIEPEGTGNIVKIVRSSLYDD